MYKSCMGCRGSDKTANIKTEGTRKYTCTNCGETKTETIARLVCTNHAWDAGGSDKTANIQDRGKPGSTPVQTVARQRQSLWTNWCAPSMHGMPE